MADKEKRSRPATELVHGGSMRSQFGETSEAMFVTQGFVYADAEAAEARFKGDDPGALVEGIRKVSRGHFAFSPKVQERCKSPAVQRRGEVTPPKTKLDSLSPREQEVLRLIGRGLTRSEIAETLCRSAKTVDGHREKIMEKLDIHDRGELVRFAIREGLVEA